MAITKYMVADGSDVAEGSLNLITPQPKSAGIQVTRRTHAASGAVYDDGLYVLLEWNVLDETAFQTIMTAFGLSASTLTNAVTVGVRNQLFSWVRMNGIAVAPEIGRDGSWSNFFPRGFTILVKELTTAS